MMKNIAIGKLVLLISIFGLISCESVPSKITINPALSNAIKEVAAVEGLLLDKSDNAFLADADGNVIKTCKERVKSKTPCRGVENGNITNVRTITVVDWKINPRCRTYYIGGNIYERCY